MLFNSFEFLVFFPVVTLIYFIIPRKIRYIWLLVASYFFYMNWNAKYALLIAFSTIVTWASGLFMASPKTKSTHGHRKAKSHGQALSSSDIKRKKIIVAVSFSLNLSILAFFKYFDFALENVNAFLNLFNIQAIDKPFDILLPVGISFYTFQALSYTVDVYRGEIEPEKNLLKYALFVSFFPQLVAGPIERSKNLLNQLRNIENIKCEYERIYSGLIIMLWGLFQKMVIADRIAVVVDTVYDSYYFYGTVELLVAAVAFSLQIYCDFASYSTIAIGAAKVMGFELMENFNTPYFSKSIKEFWRRWHISLSTWFKDYLYIPLGGSRCSKIRNYINLMITFLVSGLWHGASWNFVVWGAIHGIYQIIGAETKPIKDKINSALHTKVDSFSYKFGQTFITFVLTTFAWIFFRAQTLSDACGYIKRIFTKANWWTLSDGTLFTLGLDRLETDILIGSLVLMFAVSLIRYIRNEQIDEFLNQQCIWFRWGVIAMLYGSIFLFGFYGPGFDANQFIYFQF